MTATRKPGSKSEKARPARREPTPIRLNDLIPPEDVTGGRTVFGSSSANTPPLKRKPQK